MIVVQYLGTLIQENAWKPLLTPEQVRGGSSFVAVVHCSERIRLGARSCGQSGGCRGLVHVGWVLFTRRLRLHREGDDSVESSQTGGDSPTPPKTPVFQAPSPPTGQLQIATRDSSCVPSSSSFLPTQIQLELRAPTELLTRMSSSLSQLRRFQPPAPSPSLQLEAPALAGAPTNPRSISCSSPPARTWRFGSGSWLQFSLQ
jgi:hypothetical protein